MANRLVKNTVVLCKVETVYATDAVPVGATDAMLVSDLSIEPIKLNKVDRNLIRPYLGGSELLPGTRYAECKFAVEFVGSGTVATAPAWAAPLRASAFAQTLTATVRADYLPISTAMESATIYWYDDGVFHKFTGARGKMSVMKKIGETPKLSFSFTGLYSTPTAVANPAAVLTAFKIPQVITDSNTGDLTFGATHATGTAPLLTAGTVYPSLGLEVDLGHAVDFNAFLGGETVDLTNRVATGKFTLDLTAAQEVAFYGQLEAATLQSIGLTHGTMANNKALTWMPSCQLTDTRKAEVNGKRVVEFDFRANPLLGNDEVRLVTSF